MQSFPYLVSLCRSGGAYASVCLWGYMATPCFPVSGDVGDFGLGVSNHPYRPLAEEEEEAVFIRDVTNEDPPNAHHAQHRPVEARSRTRRRLALFVI